MTRGRSVWKLDGGDSNGGGQGRDLGVRWFGMYSVGLYNELPKKAFTYGGCIVGLRQ